MVKVEQGVYISRLLVLNHCLELGGKKLTARTSKKIHHRTACSTMARTVLSNVLHVVQESLQTLAEPIECGEAHGRIHGTGCEVLFRELGVKVPRQAVVVTIKAIRGPNVHSNVGKGPISDTPPAGSAGETGHSYLGAVDVDAVPAEASGRIPDLRARPILIVLCPVPISGLLY